MVEYKHGDMLHSDTEATINTVMTAGYAAMLALMQRFLNGLLDPFISPIELHNLMY
ncbi:hypothetical protein HGQ19_001970 [Salmonella enterica]|nr:hypothetical protein [Salmonella enterica subsp. salamae serovar 16:m,t:-]EHJ8950940.1 hypothetical protein [Salmonella enterica]EHJ6519921.1 hypothetical protein [Salmonella enterica subsp. salamae serovar 16:m,t:-]EHK5216978.1 hypothetical protein [Salmonella enterica]EHK6270386.1 hypothetical protein [Salmonella enterica]